LFDWGDGNDSGWVGPYLSGQTGEAFHIWTDCGEYEVKVKAKDNFGVQSDWSEPANIIIAENEPPDKPIITGPTTGTPRKSLKFTFSSTDPEGHDLYYMVSWGDDKYEPYTGPYTSGEEVEFSHAWSEPGNYIIIVKIRDKYGAKSPQNYVQLRIIKNKAIYNTGLIKLFEHLVEFFPTLEKLFYL
jgi:hypothetical protein